MGVAILPGMTTLASSGTRDTRNRRGVSRLAGFLDAGSSLVVALPNRFGPTSNLDSLRKQGDTDPAVAVTYRIGCN